MTVLALNSAPFMGGAEASLIDLARRLDPGRLRPILAAPGTGAYLDRVAEAGLCGLAVDLGGTNFADRRSLLRVARGLAALIRRERIGVVLVNSFPLVYAAALTRRLARVPVVMHLRDAIAPEWHGPLRTRILASMDRLLANSEFVRATAGPLAKRTEVVYNGFSLPDIRPTRGDRDWLRKETGAAGPLVGVLGHLIPRKGLDEFLEAAARVHAACPDARFFIIGQDPRPDGGYDRHLKARAGELGIAGACRFTGYVTNPLDWIHGLDMVAMPSWAEPFGRVAVEAALLERPVIACAAGGAPEIVRDGETGLLVPPRSGTALAAALLRLASDPVLRARLATAAREDAARRFSMERHVERMQAILLETAGARR